MATNRDLANLFYQNTGMDPWEAEMRKLQNFAQGQQARALLGVGSMQQVVTQTPYSEPMPAYKNPKLLLTRKA